ncbi:helix-turn-helix domain-containing protein [Actinomadura fibrosa]|uniref:Helix-turn-helix domain-containing protein n=1 Tax=Actinomadura fibrosa TaxID=111802 RepID=A0ABW2XEQ9_9ACTN|nr:helix-turn-helix domain-containing protein [Actinomadura fibrosa]
MGIGGGTVSRFGIGAGYAFYRGPSTDGAPHAHAAFQIAIAGRGEVTMVDAAGTRHRAAALLVPPMVRHRLVAAPDLVTYYVDPHCVLADRLRERSPGGIAAVPEMRGLREEEVRPAGARASGVLDGRLVEAMGILAAERVAMPDVAARVGLSPQRLRALARAELGMPLARWRIWQGLGRAAEVLGAGRPPAAAAVAGGFADQAHLHRRMREMIGLTPATVLRLLGGSAAARDVHGDRAVDR